MIVRRYDQRNTSDRCLAVAALISNISEREGRFRKIRDEEKILAVKMLMPESLLNYRFRGTIRRIVHRAGELIIDKVTKHSACKGDEI